MVNHHLEVEVNVIDTGIAAFDLEQTDADSGNVTLRYQGVMGRYGNMVTDNGRLQLAEVLARVKPEGAAKSSDDEFMLVGQGEWDEASHQSFFGDSKGESVTLGMRMEGCNLVDGRADAVRIEGKSLKESVISAMVSPVVGKRDGVAVHRFMFSFEISQEPIREMAIKHESFLLEFDIGVGFRKQRLMFVVCRHLFEGTGFIGKADKGITVH